MSRVFLLIVAVIALSAGLHAQYGRDRRDSAGTAPPAVRRDVIVVFKGVLKQMKKKEILIEGEDHQLMTIRRNKATRFLNNDRQIKATDIDLETPIVVEANEDTDLKMVAVNVQVNGHK